MKSPHFYKAEVCRSNLKSDFKDLSEAASVCSVCMEEKEIEFTESFYEFQKKKWIVFRYFWIYMGILLIAVAFGLFGVGLLSGRTYSVNGIYFE